MTWRRDHVATSAHVALSREVEKSESKGKKAPTKLNANQLAAVEARYPPDICEVLRLDTGDLQAEGWSVPPGSKWVTYWRASDALESLSRRSQTKEGKAVDTIVFAVSSRTVSGKTLPPLRRGLQLTERVHQALARTADGASAMAVSQLVGKDERNEMTLGHQHVYLLPVATRASSLDPAKRDTAGIDHLVVHLRTGMTAETRTVVETGLRAIYAREAMLKLVPLWAGSAAGFGKLAVLRSARVWLSHTPYVCPRHLKATGRHSLFGQVDEELRSLGVKGLQSVEFESRDGWASADRLLPALGGSNVSTRWRRFLKERSTGPRAPGRQPGLGLRLTFDQSVQGPISIGYGSHYGLGLFEAVDAQ